MSIFFFKSGSLWATDGTAAGSHLVTNAAPEDPGSPWLQTIGNKVFYVGTDGELWSSDGTAGGTHQVKDINGGAPGSSPGAFTKINGKLLFYADDGAHGRELWSTDGTTGGTQLVADINPGANWSYNFNSTSPTSLGSLYCNINGTLYFDATDGSHGFELWQSDGTAGGTRMVGDIRPGTLGSQPFWLTNVNGTLYFTAEDDTHGQELWRLDAAGTPQVIDLDPGLVSSSPSNLVNDNGTGAVEGWLVGNGHKIGDASVGTASSSWRNPLVATH